MHLFRLFFLGVTLALLFTTCTQRPQILPESETHSAVVNAPFQVVWNELSDYLQARQIKLKIRKAESGFIDTGYMRVESAQLSRYASTAGSRPSKLQFPGRIKATIYLWKISDNETLVTIDTQIEVWENPDRYSDGGWLYAQSTGGFESEIMAGIYESRNLVEK